MEINQEYLHNKYNATSLDDGNGGIETYESWLERQLISRIKKLEKIGIALVDISTWDDALAKEWGDTSGMASAVIDEIQSL